MKIKLFILFLMLFLHTIADYNLQGWLAQAKRKDYWENQDKKYQKDYLMALFVHSFQWTFMIQLPLIFTVCDLGLYFFLFPINVFLHFLIDNSKANDKILNLIQDQILHIIQIVVSWTVVFVTK